MLWLQSQRVLGKISKTFFFLQVQDMVNKIDDGSGVLDFEDFLMVISIFFLMVKKILAGDNNVWF